MKRLLYFLICLFGIFSVTAWALGAAVQESSFTTQTDAKPDTLQPRYSVRKTVPNTLTDLNKGSADLRDPENIKQEVVYDQQANSYSITSKVGNSALGVPLLLTSEEFQAWQMKQSLQSFFRVKNAEAKEKGEEEFKFLDKKFDLNAMEKIFGPGGVKFKMNGSAEIQFGAKYRNVENPSLPVKNRTNFAFDFDQKINTSITASVGDKVNFDLNYNTDAVFDFDTQKIKLKYEGKEDEIIKLLEGGNVSMPSNNPLIQGVNTLFGIRADLQFGKLNLQTVVSQQESESKTVQSKGGAQTTKYEIAVDNYDENRHFFLAHYFRETYDKNTAQLPTVLSGITINRAEVWITNKRGNYDNPRNIVAFTDMAEGQRISKPDIWIGTGNTPPSNRANNLYQQMTTTYLAARQIDQVLPTLSSIPLEGSMDYEKIESARLLTQAEYTINSSLGYLSLRQMLQPDEVLAVAFEYTLNGQTYQVGEFSADIKEANNTLFLKLLKNTSNSPKAGCWDLMMKNIYALPNAFQVQKERFKLDIVYQSDTAGVYLNYIPEGKINKKLLLRVMNLDRLDANNKPNPNGTFDYIEGYTINSSNGRIIFPVIEPFGEHLRRAFGEDEIAKKYVYQELYDSTKTVAKQIAEKNKFRLQGEYKASSGATINLNAMNISRGSVRVTAGGVNLVENVDYTVDYSMGIVTILNEGIIEAGSSISATVESNSNFSMQRKTMLGMNANYEFSKNFLMGFSVMHLNEKPMTTKVNMGEEPISNTIWGVNASWKKESQWLTDMLDKVPLLNLTQPSQITLDAAFAQLVPGYAAGMQNNSSYLDDFESTKRRIDIRYPSYWMLASTPSSSRNPLFSEGSLSNDIKYGMNRSLLAWYTIETLFTRRNSSQTPNHIKNDKDQLSNHYVREVYERELFPNKEASYGETATLNILNLAFYPQERGPYNLDPDLTPQGALRDPKKRWGGVMRKIDQSDFEASNIEYLEFWMLDPFIYDTIPSQKQGGDFYINLGEVSEDVLKDGKKFFENGLPANGDETKVDKTVWGKVPKERSIVYAFEATDGARKRQDVGLNGLSSAEEAEYAPYKNYLQQIQATLDPAVYQSFLQDPAGDTYHYFRGSDYDEVEMSILDRYKKYNNTEGNSVDSKDSPESYGTSSKSMPDVEDINQDFTLNENEKYFQYKISLSKDKMVVGSNYIADERKATVKLRNGKTEEVSWYQFKVPVKEYEQAVGSIVDFKSIRFMRMFLTNFEQPVFLRFATLELVQGDWRKYEQALYPPTSAVPSSNGTIDVSAVNLEENGDRKPVNYVMPPGISRVIDPSQPQLRQQNEQAMSLRITNLAPGDARAVYKTSGLDLRNYKQVQMFSHAEAFMNNLTDLRDQEVSVFIRFGSDYKNNYYEYEIPLKLTPEGNYDGGTRSGTEAVWPLENMLDIDFDVFTALKKRRNTEKNRPGSNVSYGKLFYMYDPNKPANRVSIVGNPSLAEAKTIMIGVRNNGRSAKSIEVWVNELRLKGFEQEGGWAAKANMNVQLSDLGSLNMGGRVETAGFGGLEQSMSERRLDNFYQYSVTTNLELGKFFPEKAKVKLPLYYSVSKELLSPKYDPLNKDLLLDDVLETYSSQSAKDSISSISQRLTTYNNFSISNANVGISSKKPMPYDPANFSLGYSYSKAYNEGETTAWESTENWKGYLNYSYSPAVKPFEPFKTLPGKSPWLKVIKELNLNYVPQNISVNSEMSRFYHELQLRDIENLEGDTHIPINFSQEFLWNRDLSIQWDLTKNWRMSYTSATQAEIEEAYVPVNKRLYAEEYQVWKDSVLNSILNLGRPLTYQQTFTTSYKIPFDRLPLTDWVNTDLKYNSSYNWNRGVSLQDGTSMGNNISNQSTFEVNPRLNFETLYNKIPFLKEANKRTVATTNSAKKTVKKSLPKRFEKTIQLYNDTTLIIKHNLNSKKLKLASVEVDGKKHPLKYKTIDANSISIKSNDSLQVKVSIESRAKTPQELQDDLFYKIRIRTSRFLMMARNMSMSYRKTNSLALPGFLPEIGNAFGQTGINGMRAPGFDFAFAMQGDNYIQKAVDQGWLLSNDSVINPASQNELESIEFRMLLEPIRNLKIDLSASRVTNKNSSIQYMFKGMPETRSGNFTMSIVSIGSAFEKSDASNGYASKSFDQFIQNLDLIQARVEQQYQGATYPAGTTLAGQSFDPSNGTINKYSADVMVPAFLAAYTGKNAATSNLDFFPNLLSMMPNWRITYSGLGQLAIVKKYFKSLNLTHGYRSTYSVGSYNTYQSWLSYVGDLGFVSDVMSNNPVPSSIFSISAVSINEQFSPLFGVDMTFNNSISAKVEYKKSRVLNLSTASFQLIQMGSEDVVFGLGYTIIDFKLLKNSSKNKNAKNKVSNDLKLRGDISFRDQSTFSRNIQTATTQGTSGNKAVKISFSADYTFSKMLNLRAFYDWQKNTPLVSATSYPITTSDFGVSMRFSLIR